MKKIISILLVLVLHLSLYACGTDVQQAGGAAVQSKPVIGGHTQKPASGEVVESTESTGETYPWEVEFNEKAYVKSTVTAPGGIKITTWQETGMSGRERRTRYENTDGSIKDDYFYPSGGVSHFYQWDADGLYMEMHFLDNGHMDPVTKIMGAGTNIYQKTISVDGSETERFFDENENPTFYSAKSADGFYLEEQYFEDGTCKTVRKDPATGERTETEYYENGDVKKNVSNNEQTGTYSEYECYENGNMKKSVYKDPATGYSEEQEYYENGNMKKSVCKDPVTESSTEQEYYENGKMKRIKTQTAEMLSEERYDEEGFHTYFYVKNADYEVELTADETGKLIKAIENGEVKEDETTLAQYANNFNFRG